MPRWLVLGYDADVGCKALDEIDSNLMGTGGMGFGFVGGCCCCCCCGRPPPRPPPPPPPPPPCCSFIKVPQHVFFVFHNVQPSFSIETSGGQFANICCIIGSRLDE